jgi:dTDP-4-dehydrorhamnose reductase
MIWSTTMNGQPKSDSNSGLILGGSGQVGRALARLFRDATVWGREQADFLSPEAWVHRISELRPAWVINANAYTAVDLAEKPEEWERAMQINAVTPGRVAEVCAKLGIPFVHYSTDYVYPGADISVRPWQESDPTAPLNAYGRSKLAGDQAVMRAGGKWLVFRTSWVFDETGKNFVNTMLRLGSDRPELRVVADQVGAPTYAADIAWATKQALDKSLELDGFPSGVYHLCNGGATSWAGFARAIFEGTGIGCRVVDIASSEYPTPARRPLNSRMSLEKLERTFGVFMPSWQDALARNLEAKKGMEQKS